MFRTPPVHHQERFVQAVCADLVLLLLLLLLLFVTCNWVVTRWQQSVTLITCDTFSRTVYPCGHNSNNIVVSMLYMHVRA